MINELIIEKIVRKLQISLSFDHLEDLYEKITLMLRTAESNNLITTNFKAKLLLAKYYLVKSKFQESKDLLLEAIASSKIYKLPKFTQLFEVEYQKAQMNSIYLEKSSMLN